MKFSRGIFLCFSTTTIFSVVESASRDRKERNQFGNGSAAAASATKPGQKGKKRRYYKPNSTGIPRVINEMRKLVPRKNVFDLQVGDACKVLYKNTWEEATVIRKEGGLCAQTIHGDVVVVNANGSNIEAGFTRPTKSHKFWREEANFWIKKLNNEDRKNEARRKFWTSRSGWNQTSVSGLKNYVLKFASPGAEGARPTPARSLYRDFDQHSQDNAANHLSPNVAAVRRAHPGSDGINELYQDIGNAVSPLPTPPPREQEEQKTPGVVNPKQQRKIHDEEKFKQQIPGMLEPGAPGAPAPIPRPEAERAGLRGNNRDDLGQKASEVNDNGLARPKTEEELLQDTDFQKILARAKTLNTDAKSNYFRTTGAVPSIADDWSDSLKDQYKHWEISLNDSQKEVTAKEEELRNKDIQDSYQNVYTQAEILQIKAKHE